MIYSSKIKGYRLLEKKIHKEYSGKRIVREWFDLAEIDLIAIKSMIENAKI
ncbi:GIY-YIG nuclease family protein [Leptospira barantonii]|uniref:GIY-YIG nuclease family protein n=1 Tax=Leptospira barantonii TaxID=2023184 RepID=UPI000F648AAD